MKNSNFDIAQTVTDKIIAKMEQGIIPWKQTWKKGVVVPENYVTGKKYRGVNFLLLFMEDQYPTSKWVTFNQVKELGYTVKKGETSTMIIYYNLVIKGNDGKKILEEQYDKLSKEEKDKYTVLPFLRYHNVFNIDQTTIPLELEQHDEAPIQSCDSIYDLMPNKPSLKHESQNAFYNVIGDYINMPRYDSFTSAANYYTTLFHEMIHSTGHSSRLNRKELMNVEAFGSENYSKEELTAELGAAMLSTHTGLIDSTIDNSVAYLQGWLTKLKDDKNLIFQAAGQAQAAFDYIINTSVEKGD